ncbi:unnamed protein product [Fusarium graminearum]|uniref:Chromosome 3, complete genome n=1 Tax=Gibberella zeae (strain ATCC MYA-4620 / CBS 123657 / FGSC 9075 / NRRL 31084 / PH-1) TaxID=229533 RepID=A0A098E2E0_GIBZE|nr:unnamed protein product [Fusarium graminearum]
MLVANVQASKNDSYVLNALGRKMMLESLTPAITRPLVNRILVVAIDGINLEEPKVKWLLDRSRGKVFRAHYILEACKHSIRSPMDIHKWLQPGFKM